MFNLDGEFLNQKSAETGFNRDNLEKVYRLLDILNFINEHPALSEKLVLKGGTAINLAVFDLPRLSVDIDLDLDGEYTRNETLAARESIQSTIEKYLNASGYTLNADKGKTSHALNSWVLNYQNAGGNKDNIKIEINFTMRRHICPLTLMQKHISVLDTDIQARTLAPEELFGSKIKAFTERIAPRDLYDIYNLLHANLFTDVQWNLVRKCVWFYRAVGSTGEFQESIAPNFASSLSYADVRKTLLPVIQKGKAPNIGTMLKEVTQFLADFLVPTEQEKAFLHAFSLGEYEPSLLFNDPIILGRIEKHPMALWKTQGIIRSQVQ